jgi:hypothetical protein
VLLWRKSVSWSAARIVWLALLVLLAVLCAAAVSVGVGMLTGEHFAYFLASVLAPLVWLTGTVFVWRETRAERIHRLEGAGPTVVCPQCGYNMTGLAEARCPECGNRYTLDQLIAEQPARADSAVQ